MKTLRSLSSLLRALAVVSGALAALPSAAIVPVSGELAVNSFTTSNQRSSVIAMAADHSFVVSWESPQDGDQYGIVARRFDSAGGFLTGELAINQVTSSQQIRSAVASRPDGTFVVSWSHAADIRARVFAASGVPIGGELPINAYTTNTQFDPAVDFLPDGSFMTAWRSDGQDGSGQGVYGRRFLSSGTPATGEFRINIGTTGDQNQPALRARPDGSLVAAWRDASEGSGFGIRAVTMNPNGTFIGAQNLVNTYTTGEQESPAIGVAHDGSYVVTWESTAPSNRVVARRFEGIGTALTGELLIGTLGTSGHPPAVASNVDGSFVVAWVNPAVDIRAREFDASGSALGGEFAVNTYTTFSDWFPQIAMAPGGFFAVTWSGGGVLDIRARVLRTDRIVAEDFATPQIPTYWTAVSPDGDLAVTPAAALAGTAYGLQATVDDTTPIYLQSDLPRAEGSYRVRFYLDPNGFTVGTDGDRTKILQLFATDPVQRRLLTLVLRVQGGQYRLLAKAHQDDDSWINTGFHTIADVPHVVELSYLRQAGLVDGALAMWIDGLQVASITDLQNEAGGPVEFARWGVLSVQPGASGVLFFDLFESRRQTFIGP